MDRYADIQELLAQVESDLERLSAMANHAKQDEAITSLNRPISKSCLEHLRSALEYVAQDVHCSVKGGKRKVYFPYGRDERTFRESLNNNLPGLEKLRPDLFSEFEAIQYHRCGDSWLPDLCKLTNTNKHDRLSVTDRVNSNGRTTNLANVIQLNGVGGRVVLENSVINGVPVGFGSPFVLDAETPVKILEAETGGALRVARTYDSVRFRIKGSSYDMLGLIAESRRRIETFVARVRELLS